MNRTRRTKKKNFRVNRPFNEIGFVSRHGHVNIHNVVEKSSRSESFEIGSFHDILYSTVRGTRIIVSNDRSVNLNK